VAHCTFAGQRGQYRRRDGQLQLLLASGDRLHICGELGRLGGGMANYNSSSPAVTSCTFEGNLAQNGAGMLNDHSSPTVSSCTFVGNEAPNGSGAGVQLHRLLAHSDQLHLRGNLAFSMRRREWVNYGAGTPTLTNCTSRATRLTPVAGSMTVPPCSRRRTASCGRHPGRDQRSCTPPVVAYSDVQGTGVYPGGGKSAWILRLRTLRCWTWISWRVAVHRRRDQRRPEPAPLRFRGRPAHLGRGIGTGRLRPTWGQTSSASTP